MPRTPDSLATLLLTLVAIALAWQPLRAEEDPLLDFVVGDYVSVGRLPASGAAYVGTARIARQGGAVLLEGSRNGEAFKAEGRVEVPSPPGEGKVLNFRWEQAGPMLMSCLIGSDLDNYARLTCLWGREGGEDAPGLEAMFPVK